MVVYGLLIRRRLRDRGLTGHREVATGIVCAACSVSRGLAGGHEAMQLAASDRSLVPPRG